MCGLPVTKEESDRLSKDLDGRKEKESRLVRWLIILSILGIILAIVGKEFV